jgi:hypothetical protein
VCGNIRNAVSHVGKVWTRQIDWQLSTVRFAVLVHSRALHVAHKYALLPWRHVGGQHLQSRRNTARMMTVLLGTDQANRG